MAEIMKLSRWFCAIEKNGSNDHHLRFIMRRSRKAGARATTMAPNMAASQHGLIRDMIVDGSQTSKQMAGVAGWV